MTDERLKKLRFRAWRRGFREADLILGPFADRNLEGFDAGQLDEFELLLEQPDQDLYAWIVGREPTPIAFDSELMNRIKEFRFQAHETFSGTPSPLRGGGRRVGVSLPSIESAPPPPTPPRKGEGSF